MKDSRRGGRAVSNLTLALAGVVIGLPPRRASAYLEALPPKGIKGASKSLASPRVAPKPALEPAPSPLQSAPAQDAFIKSQAPPIPPDCSSRIASLSELSEKDAPRPSEAWGRAAFKEGLLDLKPNNPFSETMAVLPLPRHRSDAPALVDAKKALPGLKEFGITAVMTPILHPQTTSKFFSAKNDHNYWPSTFAIEQVDPALGTPGNLGEYYAQTKKLGLRNAAELGFHHFGYPEKGRVSFRLNGKDYKLSDPARFYQDPTIPTNKLNEAIQPGPALAGDKLWRGSVWGLPSLNFENPEVVDDVIEALKPQARQGNSIFRIDAARHVPLPALEKIFTEVAREVTRQGGKPRFILEDFSRNYGELAYFAAALKKVPADIYLIDFPLQHAVREAMRGGDFEGLTEPLSAITRLGLDPSRLVAQREDHDGQMPRLYDGSPLSASHSVANTVLLDALSANRAYFVAGYEQAGDPAKRRQESERFVDPSSPLYKPLHDYHALMNREYENFLPLTKDDILFKSMDSIAIRRRERRGNKLTVFIVSREPHEWADLQKKFSRGTKLWSGGAQDFVPPGGDTEGIMESLIIRGKF